MRLSLRIIVAISAIAFLSGIANARKRHQKDLAKRQHLNSKPHKYEMFFRPKPEKAVEAPLPPKKNPVDPIKAWPAKEVPKKKEKAIYPGKENLSSPRDGEGAMPPPPVDDDIEAPPPPDDEESLVDDDTLEMSADPLGPPMDHASPDEPMGDNPFEDSADTAAPGETDSPTFSPTPGFPTIAPLVDNEACDAAVVIEVGDTIVGTTEGAPDANLLECATLFGGYVAPSVFYSFTGTGDGITISFEASFDIFMHVYSGEDCESLSCVTGGGGDFDGFTELSRGSLTFASEDGANYFVVPHQFFDDGGDFEFTVTGGGELPSNGLCTDAIEIESGESVDGTTSFGVVSSEDPCLTFPSAPGVWYSTVGTGETVAFAVTADYDSQISLFSSPSGCDDLTCAGFSDDLFQDLLGDGTLIDSGVVETLEDGQQYFILVDGWSTRSGNFTLTLETVTDLVPDNDACPDAEPLDVGDSVSGSLLLATGEMDMPYCGPASNESVPGVFYTVEGTGTLMRVISEQLASVYTGDCDSLVCHAESGDFSSRVPSTIFDSTFGEEYVIFLYGPRQNFNVTVEELVAPDNDVCEDAATLEVNGPRLAGDTSISSSETDLEVCGGSGLGSVGGLWYTFTGTGGRLRLGVDADYDSQLLLYTGDCSGLICLDGNDDVANPDYQSALDFDSEDGVQYYALVHGYFSSAGSFEIELIELETPDNDDCSNATTLTIDGEPVPGDTSLSTAETGLEVCGGAGLGSVGGLWYTFVGNGERLLLGVNATFDSQLLLYTGDCDSLNCEAGNDDSGLPGYQSALEFDSVDGEVYIALVHGYFSSAGTFEIELTEIVPPENEVCVDAITVEINGPRVSGDTSRAQPEDPDLEVCGGAGLGSEGALWYQFVGNGEKLRIGVDAAYDSQVVLYSGSCFNLECLLANDDTSIPGYQSAVEFDSLDGETYYILVHGYFSAAGYFELEVIELVPPDNDECEDAIELEIDGPRVEGDTSSSTSEADTGLEECGAGPGLGSGGTWYTFTGNGLRLLLGVDAAFDSQLALYAAGSQGCEELSCLQNNDDTPDPNYQSALYFDSVEGQVYYALVHGYFSSTGSYEIELTQITPDVIAENNDCENATVIEVGEVVEGDTSQSLEETGLSTCGAGNTLGTSGLWYSFSGTGDRLLVGVRTLTTSYDSQLLLYQGDDCDNLFCLDSNQNTFVGDYDSAVIFDSEANENYYVLVHGVFTSTGMFEIEVVEQEILENDECDGASPLEIDGPAIAGNTADSLSESGLETCGSGPGLGSSGGLWYQFTGDGSRLLLGVNASFDSQLLLYSGTCDDLTCLDNNDDNFAYDQYQSALEFNSIEGLNYLALVHGYFSASGAFEIELTQVEALENDDCEGATAIEINGPAVAGNTANSGRETDAEVCGGVSSLGAGGLWYTFEGDGSELLLGVDAQFDSQLLLYSAGSSGSCDDLSCIGGSDDSFLFDYQSAVEFTSVQGATYYALVLGYSSNTGDFTIEVTSTSSPPDDDIAATLPPSGGCDEAELVEIGDTPVSGDTTGTPMESGLDTCGTVSQLGAGSVWYTFVGDGNPLLIGVDAVFDSQLLVYSGSCDDLTCVDGSDDAFQYPEFQSAVELDSEDGTVYWALIHGFSSTSQGSFTFEVIPLEPAVDDEVTEGSPPTPVPVPQEGGCEEAVMVEVDASPVAGDTTGTEMEEGLETCGAVLNLGGGSAWFSFEGDGSTLLVGVAADWDSQLLVYSGGCDDLSCVDGSDDNFAYSQFQSAIELDSVAGEQYLALVMGFSSTSFGEFEFSVTQLFAPPAADDEIEGSIPTPVPIPEEGGCEDAVMVEVDGAPTAGDTTGTVMEEGLDTCGGVTRLGAGSAWFTWEGDGSTQLVGVAADWDSQLLVYSGSSCDALDCVDGSDDNFAYSQFQSAVELESVPGEQYFGLVHGFSSTSMGEFEFSVTQLTPPSNSSGPMGDDCTAAPEILIDGPTVSGDITGTSGEALDLCGSVASIGTGGAWAAQFQGDGSTVLIGVVADGWDSQLVVYSGTGSCDQCEDSNDDAFEYAQYQSALEFETVADETYYLYVTGFRSSVGEYEVEVTTLSPPPGGEETSAPTEGSGSDESPCESATPLEFGNTTFGSTEGVPLMAAPACGVSDGFAYNLSNVFYSFVGAGAGVEIYVNSTVDFAFNIYSGQDCDSLTCITSGFPELQFDPFTGNLSAAAGTFRIFAEEGELYYFSVGSFQGSEAADIEVTVESAFAAPDNRQCEGAITIGSMETINGTTVYGSFLDDDPCEETRGSSGVWYTMDGSNKTMLLALVADFDVRITLFSGACGDFSCVNFNDDLYVDAGLGVPIESGIVEELQDGVTYYIFVDGFASNNGNFTLFAEPADLVDNDSCEGAQAVELDTVVPGNTVFATSDEGLPFCGFGTNESDIGVFYTVEGTGSFMKISFEPSAIGASVYSGDSCDDLTCVSFSSFTTEDVFQSVEGENYTIYVHGDRGFNFNMTVAEVEQASNDQCDNATILFIDGSPVAGDTTASLAETGLDFCGSSFSIGENGGVWYSFVGNGEMLLLGVNATFDSQLLVYTGDSCDALECYDGNDDNFNYGSLNYNSALEIDSELGVTYYVLVHGFSSAFGEFEIELQEIVAPPNDCRNAISLEVGDVMEGTTLFVDEDEQVPDYDCGSSYSRNFSTPGVWYTVPGSGATMAAELSGASFNSQLTVFAGDDCDTLACVDGDFGFGGTVVVWESEQGQNYYVYVHGDAGGQFGAFELSVVDVERPTNDECSEAVALEIGDMVTGSTKYANQSDFVDCDAFDSNFTESQLWYTISGSAIPSGVVEKYTSKQGGQFVFFANITMFDGDHLLLVYAGDSCDILTCVANTTGGFDFTTGLEAPGAYLEWDVDPAKDYYIAVLDLSASSVSGLDFAMEIGAFGSL